MMILLNLMLLIVPVLAVQDVGEVNERAIAHHMKRCLDDASREYKRVIEMDTPREPTAEEKTLAIKFAPRLFVMPTEFFPLKDFAVLIHPTEPLIAYHLFWEDDIDFPEDNDPCDHELIWVRYSSDRKTIEKIWTYFHGRILEGGAEALADARRNGMRPRINVQWGKHGSLPHGWEEMRIVAESGDIEKKYYPTDQGMPLRIYQEGTYRKLSEEGRRLIDHPLAARLGWPSKFTGSWKDFTNFSKLIDPVKTLERTKMIKVSKWNNATINQYFLTYNFRPKTEWP